MKRGFIYSLTGSNCFCFFLGYRAESPQRNPGSCDRRIGMGIDAPHCRHSQFGSGRSGCTMRSAQYR